MESRIYATILLLVFGIVQAHSHPQGRNALHELPEFGDLRSSIGEPQFGYSVGSNFYGDLGDDPVDRRIKREIESEASAILERLYKLKRFDTDDAHRAYNTNPQVFLRILDRSVKHDLSAEEAVHRPAIHHPNRADRAVGNHHGVVQVP